MSEKIIVSSVINADTTKVWECYTHPQHIVNWNFAAPTWHCPSATNDLRVGGIYNARMEAKDGSFGFDFEAVYTDVVEGKEFTYEFGGRMATVEFNPSNTSTEIKVIFDAETENPIEFQKAGWQAILNNFKNYVESI